MDNNETIGDFIDEHDPTGQFYKLSDDDQKAVKWMVYRYHHSNGVRHPDGSLGTIKITPGQLRDALADAIFYANGGDIYFATDESKGD